MDRPGAENHREHNYYILLCVLANSHIVGAVMTTNNKPRYIEALHTAPITFDLEELGIDFDKVEDYHIEYGILTVTFKDGTTKTYSNGDVGDVEYKYAYQETIYDSNWYEVEETI